MTESGESMDRVRFILVGGFLGAGKTTLLAAAARKLVERGMRVGLITNDQAANLVDTEILRQEKVGVGEIAGGCFCCRFGNLISSSEDLIARYDPHVLIGEPVGSCTDLSATVLQPLKKYHGDRFQLSPFSVLADPMRLAETLSDDANASLPASVCYVFGKQLEEADLVVLNKTDLVSPEELDRLEKLVVRAFGDKEIVRISALTGEGVEAWLDRVLADVPAGRWVADVDYDTYAEGEAVLGWFNAAVELRAAGAPDWPAFCRDLMGRLHEAFLSRSAEVAHVKLRLAAGGDWIQANLTSNRSRPVVGEWQGGGDRGSRDASLILNARVNLSPEELQTAMESCLQAAAGRNVHATVSDLASFSPARPQPTHRFDSVV